MIKVKNSVAALFALTALAIAAGGCKETECEGLPPATVIVKATVYDIATGEVLADATCTPDASVTIGPGEDGTIAAQTVEIKASLQPDYIDNTVTVSVPALPKGKSAYIPLQIYLRPVLWAIEEVTETPDPKVDPVPTEQPGERITVTNDTPDRMEIAYTYPVTTGQIVLNLDELHARIDDMPELRAVTDLTFEQVKAALKAQLGIYDQGFSYVDADGKTEVPAQSIVKVTPVTSYLTTEYTMQAKVNGKTWTIDGVKVQKAIGTVAAPGEPEFIGDSTAHVYVSGRLENSNMTSVACCWKDGAATKLSVDDGYCSAVIAADSSVYLAGYGDNSACYWKDGLRNGLSADYGEVKSIAVAADSSVYVVGETGYWKDGMGTSFGTDDFTCQTIAIDTMGTVHFLGDIRQDGSGPRTAGAWTNGAITPFGKDKNSAVTCAAAPGNSVFVGGYFYDEGTLIQHPCYWVDGKCVTLNVPTGMNFNSVTAIYVHETSVYTAGYAENENGRIACYWKGTAYQALEVPSGAKNATATGIVVSLGKVYISGTYQSGNSVRACCWIDGVRTDLQPENATDNTYATGIAVVE